MAGAVGYMIRGSLSIYFAGDTGLFDSLGELGEGLDVALLPIWGWGLRLPADHMSPETAAQALRILRPRLAIPIHWGTFLPLGVGMFYSHYLVDPPRDFVAHAREYAPDVPTVVLRPGESIKLDELLDPAATEERTGDRAWRTATPTKRAGRRRSRIQPRSAPAFRADPKGSIERCLWSGSFGTLQELQPAQRSSGQRRHRLYALFSMGPLLLLTLQIGSVSSAMDRPLQKSGWRMHWSSTSEPTWPPC
jgi:hypothetical protein